MAANKFTVRTLGVAALTLCALLHTAYVVACQFSQPHFSGLGRLGRDLERRAADGQEHLNTARPSSRRVGG